MLALPNAYSAEPDMVRYLSITEVTQTSITLAEQSVEDGDFDNAKKLIEFGSKQFSNNLEKLREADASLTDEVHISLIDLQTKEISSENRSSILSEINRINEILDSIPEDPEITPNVIVAHLIIVDQQYENFEITEDEFSYNLALGFMQRANQMFYSQTDYGERQKIEIESFFNDMFEMVQNRDPYASIASTNVWVQRDLLGTDVIGTIGLDSTNLYSVIRDLYDDLMVELDNGDYKKAEQIGIEAYLENFEYLEPEIEVADAELLYQLEWDMREELRTMIKNRESPETIKSFLVDSIIPRLDLSLIHI